ncbi:hypothetical protein G7046_g5223 [Stylonectria norvegica]|nr:hypothetical protein G7046_g5223 [Stylonectria norvegica]
MSLNSETRTTSSAKDIFSFSRLLRTPSALRTTSQKILMSFYAINLAGFAAVDAYLLYRQYRVQNPSDRLPRNESAKTTRLDDGIKFQEMFYPVYALAVAADWLQGPHIYAIYKYEKQIPEKTVAMLYASGFVSGALSAAFAGQLADRYGRRLACLVYCLCYSITCLTMLSDNLAILFVGRIFGGIATTLLFSVFEAWMITEYHARDLQQSTLTLSGVFANMTVLSGTVAILAGIVGDLLVGYLGTRVWPFVASIAACIGAAAMIFTSWAENYGQRQSKHLSLAETKIGIIKILTDTKVLALGVTSCCFEGTMYLFVFFWSAALKSARTRAGSDEELPFGLIFSSFMCAMMFGSAMFSVYNRPHSGETAAFLLMVVVLVVSACLSEATVLESEHLLFWALCVVEAAIGAYFPSIASLKSERIDDGVRGSVYSLLRLPLNVFVVVAHSLDEEGIVCTSNQMSIADCFWVGDAHRHHVFMTCAALLLLAFCVMKRNL